MEHALRDPTFEQDIYEQQDYKRERNVKFQIILGVSIAYVLPAHLRLNCKVLQRTTTIAPEWLPQVCAHREHFADAAIGFVVDGELQVLCWPI